MKHDSFDFDEPVSSAGQRLVVGGRRGWHMALVGFVLLFSALLLAYVVVIGINVARMSTRPLNLAGLATDETGRTNILVLGQGDPGHDGENLTDTMMLMSVDNQSKRLAEVSVPRDLRVEVPGFGDHKINAANALGGVNLAEQTVSDTLGVPINYYVQTDFSGLKALVDAVGGIDVNVKERLTDHEYPCDNDQYKVCGLDIQPGQQHMDGTRALQYVRCRKGTCGNDFGRAQRQQEVIGLVRAKLTQWQNVLNPFRMQHIAVALNQALKTDMGSVQMLQLGLLWRRAPEPVRLVLHTGPGGYLQGDSGGSSDLLPVGGSFNAIQERVKHIFTDAPQSTDLPAGL